MNSWARFKEAAPEILNPNHVGLETRNLKRGIRTMIEEDMPIEITDSAEELEYRGKDYGDLEYKLEKDGEILKIWEMRKTIRY